MRDKVQKRLLLTALQDRSGRRALGRKFRLISEPGVVLVPFTPTDRPAGRLDLIASLPLLLPSITPPALALVFIGTLT